LRGSKKRTKNNKQGAASRTLKIEQRTKRRKGGEPRQVEKINRPGQPRLAEEEADGENSSAKTTKR